MNELLPLAMALFLACMIGCTATAPTTADRPGNAAAARLDAWRVLGPGGGGTMVAPVISPHDPNTALVHCDMTGAYLTRDGGKSWRMFNLRSVASALAFDPTDANVLYGGNHALWQSRDAGNTWHMIWPDPAQNTVEQWRGDHAEPVLRTDDRSYPAGGGGISAIAVNPSDGRHVVVVMGGKMYETRDGATFAPVTGPDDAIDSVCFTTHGPTLFAIGAAGLHRQDGQRWSSISLPGPQQPATARARRGSARSISVAWPKGQPQATIYVAGPGGWKDGKLTGGIVVSTDGGQTWRDALGDLPESLRPSPQGRAPATRLVTSCAADPRIAYATLGIAAGDRPGAATHAIIKTTDAGQSWQVVHQESPRRSPTMQGSWFEKRAEDPDNSVYFEGCYSLTCSPTDPNVCYATDLFRTYMTPDGGTSWRQCHSAAAGEPTQDHWTTRGLDVTTCYGVHFDPFDHQNVAISYTDIGLFRSADGGTGWVNSIAGLPKEWHNTTYWLEYDPKVPGLVWGAFSGTHDLPRPKMWRATDPSRYRGGVATSTDGGKTWVVTNQGMPQTAVTHVLVDPDSPPGNRTLYACGFGTGLFKSTDNGKTWTLKNQGISGAQPFAWRIVRSPDKSLYLIVARRKEANPNQPTTAPADEGSGALYRSTDGAHTWAKVNLPPGCTGPNGLAIDPTNANRLYLAAWAQLTPRGNEGGGVFASDDGGQTWRNLLSIYPHAYDVTIDPADPKVLYVCGFDYGAYRSPDAGATWQRIKGYNFKWGHRVVPDPDRPEMIYITTFGGSVWHGPAKGDPRATEDTLPSLPPMP